MKIKVFAALLFFSCFTIGCIIKGDSENLGFVGKTVQVNYEFGDQKVINVSYDNFANWMTERQNKIRIISISDVGRSSYGSTSSFIIVYEDSVSVNSLEEKE